MQSRAPMDFSEHFIEFGWVKFQLNDVNLIYKLRTDIIEHLKEKQNFLLPALEEYHDFVNNDEEHTKYQVIITEFYREKSYSTQLLKSNINHFYELIGKDLHQQTKPYLRIARPNKYNDNIGYHRDTWYGGMPYELSVLIPLTDMDENNTLSFIPKSHIAKESDYLVEKHESTEVTIGSEKHLLGFPYAPKILTQDIQDQLVPIPLKVGEGIIFNFAMMHGQVVNLSHTTRFSTDIRVVSSFAPIQWERNVSKEMYKPLTKSPVNMQAEMYYKNNAEK